MTFQSPFCTLSSHLLLVWGGGGNTHGPSTLVVGPVKLVIKHVKVA